MGGVKHGPTPTCHAVWHWSRTMPPPPSPMHWGEIVPVGSEARRIPNIFGAELPLQSAWGTSFFHLQAMSPQQGPGNNTHHPRAGLQARHPHRERNDGHQKRALAHANGDSRTLAVCRALWLPPASDDATSGRGLSRPRTGMRGPCDIWGARCGRGGGIVRPAPWCPPASVQFTR